jgi:hypothetical protein
LTKSSEINAAPKRRELEEMQQDAPNDDKENEPVLYPINYIYIKYNNIFLKKYKYAKHNIY